MVGKKTKHFSRRAQSHTKERCTAYTTRTLATISVILEELAILLFPFFAKNKHSNPNARHGAPARGKKDPTTTNYPL